MKTNKIAMLGIGMALYVVLGFTIKIPLIAHIQTDLGYTAFGCFLYLIGWQACIVGVVGCLLESLIFSGWIPIGWMIGHKVTQEYLRLNREKRELIRERDSISAKLEMIEDVLIDLNDILRKHGNHIYEHFEENEPQERKDRE